VCGIYQCGRSAAASVKTRPAPPAHGCPDGPGASRWRSVAAGVLAHRRDSDAVGQSEIANGIGEKSSVTAYAQPPRLGSVQVGLDVSRIEKSVCGMIEDGENRQAALTRHPEA